MIVSKKLRDSAGHHNAYCTVQEVWRPVLGWEGLYEVSTNGGVRSVDRVMECSNGKRRHCLSQALRKQILRNGYERVILCRSGREQGALVHRLVAESFIPGVGVVVRHMDGVKTRNTVGNLCWGSHAQNANDKRAHGKHLFGEKHPNATMSESDVLAVRKMHGDGMSQLAICRSTGLGRGAVGYAVRGETWRHL